MTAGAKDALLASAVNNTGKVRPTQPALKRACCSRSSAWSSYRRRSFSASGTWSGAPAAGVPGRDEYLKLNAWEKPTARTSASVSPKSAAVSPG